MVQTTGEHIKLNTDASVNDSKGCGIGCLGRDTDGAVLFIASKCVQPSSNVEIVDAEGIIWALEICVEGGLPKVWVDCDCHTLIMKLQEDSIIKGELGSLLHKIKTLAAQFLVCQVEFHPASRE